MTVIFIVVIAGALVVCGLIIALAIFAVRRSKFSSTESEDNAVTLESLKPDANNAETQYQRLSTRSPYQPVGQPLTTGVEVSTSDESQPTKSWEINFAELSMLETVGEGGFGTVHRAIFRHQQVAVKQLKNQIDQREVLYICY
jgi:hypothetical protein